MGKRKKISADNRKEAKKTQTQRCAYFAQKDASGSRPHTWRRRKQSIGYIAFLYKRGFYKNGKIAPLCNL